MAFPCTLKRKFPWRPYNLYRKVHRTIYLLANILLGHFGHASSRAPLSNRRNAELSAPSDGRAGEPAVRLHGPAQGAAARTRQRHFAAQPHASAMGATLHAPACRPAHRRGRQAPPAPAGKQRCPAGPVPGVRPGCVPRAAHGVPAEQQFALALSDGDREYFRELKDCGARDLTPAPCDFFELVRSCALRGPERLMGRAPMRTLLCGEGAAVLCAGARGHRGARDCGRGPVALQAGRARGPRPRRAMTTAALGRRGCRNACTAAPGCKGPACWPWQRPGGPCGRPRPRAPHLWRASWAARGAQLGVDLGAGAAEIKASYRALARLVHPDIAGEAAMAALLNVAYATLSSDHVRSAYAQDVRAPPPGVRAAPGSAACAARRLTARRAPPADHAAPPAGGAVPPGRGQL